MVLGAPFACALAIVVAGLSRASLAQADNGSDPSSSRLSSSSPSRLPASTSTSTSTKPTVLRAATPAPSHCEARTINYITHSLPQSCLKSSWAGFRDHASQAAASNTTHRSNATSEATAVDAASTGETQSLDAAATPFMSFEDWKEMMLRRAGQDPQEWRSRKPSLQQKADKSPPGPAHHAGLGEEDEISLNFDDYRHGEDKASAQETKDGNSNLDEKMVYGDAVVRRGKDAGKTCKERFSYASFDAGATVLKTAAGAQNSKAILVENKDTYMLLECSAPAKYVIVELSDDILIDTVVLANFEFFSSMIRHFRVSVSDRYPVKLEKWRELGVFEARNYRDVQPFLVENPQMWAKYVKVEFLTHYGNEYYCPVSLLRIHGSRMLDSWKDIETGRDDDAHQVEGQESPRNSIQGEIAPSPVGSTTGDVYFSAYRPSNSTPWSKKLGVNPFSAWAATCPAGGDEYMPPPAASQTLERHSVGSALQQSMSSAGNQQGNASLTPKSAGLGSSETPSITQSAAISSSTAGSSGDASIFGRDATGSDVVSPAATHEGARERGANVTAATINKPSASGPGSGKPRASGTSGPTAASPTVQEGFFNVITKRLQQVESNLTLSLKYVEDQSRHVQEALLRGEQKQHAKIVQFLDDLNKTVLSELRNVRDQYDQIWQSTVLALETQADRSERDMMALSARLNLLADEVVFQKRMAIVQAVILLSCLFLVIFSRGVPISPFSSPPAPSATAIVYGESSAGRDEWYQARQHRRRGMLAAGDGANSAQSMPAAEPHAVGGRPSSAQSSEDLEVTAPDYRGLSPPLTPGLSDQAQPPHVLASGQLFGLDGNHARRSPLLSQVNARKPLPSLPEHPSTSPES